MCGTTTETNELPVAETGSSCACCSGETSTGATTGDIDQNLVQATYAVTGMTCGHCATAVSSELQELEGVSTVQVDLVAGGISTVSVASQEPLAEEQVSVALAEAGGYELTATN
ncbi:heavy-metal-associated domain-containing protein [Serinicoccus sp. LYQ131]|uniref:heavy-metal-associated domain-containing protein n=1 Tax=Serinicoccus sp. LYQ131 TaxID=3378797 RepID=UPI0038526AE6